MKKYDVINFKGLDWYVIDTNKDTTKLLLKNVLDAERIKKYSDDDFMIEKHEVRHQDSIREYEWDKSYIKNTILPNFKKDLDIECEIDLLSKEEAETLPDEIRKTNDWYWTKSKEDNFTRTAFSVYSYGYVSSYFAYLGRGARPVLNLKSNILTEDNFVDIEEINLDQYYGIKDSSLGYDTIAVINDLIKNQKVLINKIKEEGK